MLTKLESHELFKSKAPSLFQDGVLGYHWLPLATIDLVGDIIGNLKFKAYFELLDHMEGRA